TVISRASATSAKAGDQRATVVGGEVAGLRVLGTDVLSNVLGTTKVDLAGITAAQLAAVNHVTSVEVTGTNPFTGSTLLKVMGDKQIARGGREGRATVGVVRDLDTVVPIEVGGVAAAEREFLEALSSSAPKTLMLVYLLSFVVLGVGFRSITLPLKAIVLDSLSILASFGVLVLVFQDGHGIQLLGAQPLGYTDATLPIMLFCILYSLSMDYEVFMLAKVTEGYQQGLGVEEATARGVASTAPLITGAALILIVIGISFALTGLVLIKQIGFGMAVALAIDATLVRFVLLPALMRYLGELNWWMPRWLATRVPRLEWAH
ncbi:MAG: MMPL family transporter, partial [Thermoleophilia bacterium]|nr:MMPL family transporter [Thermoleophilia bacterium]